MNKKSLLPEVSKGGEQSDISSCFVSSASSSLSAAHSLHPRQPPHAAAHHRQRELSADLFAHSRDIEDDSLRVSSSTLFHNSTTVSSALDSPSESNAPAHDDLQSYSPANDRISHREDQRSHHHQYPSAATSHVDHSQSYHLLLATPEGRFDFQQVDGDRASFSRRSAGHRDVRPEPTGPRFDLSHPHSGMEMKTAGDFQDGDHDDDKEHRNRLCQPHDDVGDDAYRRSCASGAGHHDRSLAPEAGASHSEHFLGDGCYRGVCGDGVFAPRQFKQRIADTLLERMRSRADVDAAVVLIGTPAAANATLDEKKVSSPMAVLDETEARMIRNTVLAKKRVRVAQLLIVGLLSLFFGWLGNFFVTSSCYFASSAVMVGQSGEPFVVHYGLWKYSTVDSVVSGSYNCYPYHSAQHRAPVVSRVANLLALLLGTYSQGCVWTYLITGQWHPKLWHGAVHASVVAGVLQLLTLCFFAERVCRASQNRCGMGPASVVAVVTAVVWLVFAWEVHYNTPRGTESMIASLEMRDLHRASAEFMTRFQQPEKSAEYRPPELMKGSVYA